MKYIGPASEREESVIPTKEHLVRRVSVDEFGFANCSCGRTIDELLPCVHVMACFDACTPAMWHLRWTNVFARCFLADGCEEETALMAKELERMRDGKRAWRGVNVNEFLDGPEDNEDYPIYLFRSDSKMFEGELNKVEGDEEDTLCASNDTPYDDVNVYVSPAKKKIDEAMAVELDDSSNEDAHYTWIMKMGRELHKAAGSNAELQRSQREMMVAMLREAQASSNGGEMENEGLSFGGGEKERQGKAVRKKACYERRK